MLAGIRPIFLATLVLLITFTTSLESQVHGVPASVSSFGFGGNMTSAPGVAASVTSLGPRGFGNSRGVFAPCCFNRQIGFNGPTVRRGHHNRNLFAVPVYSVPYSQVFVVQPDAEGDDEEYQGGPTVFDRRGPGAQSPRERVVRTAPATQTVAALNQAPEPVVAQPSTVLVFKDGHQSEVQNYAIVGPTLFDLTDNRSHKIQLADLDLTATRKANGSRGVDFQIPAESSQ